MRTFEAPPEKIIVRNLSPHQNQVSPENIKKFPTSDRTFFFHFFEKIKTPPETYRPKNICRTETIHVLGRETGFINISISGHVSYQN